MNTTTRTPPPAADAAARGENPLLAPWPGPHGGVPPFDRVTVPHIREALDAAIAEKLAEVERIAANPAPPDFQNTVVAYDRAGATLERVRAVFRVWSWSLSSADFQAVEREMAPRLAALSDRIKQNEALFRRLRTVHESADAAGLSKTERRLAWHHHRAFVRAGALLAPEAKARLTEINQALAELQTRFGQNVLADEAEQCLVLRDEAELAGLPESAVDAAESAAAEKGLAGAWVVLNTRSAVEPVLTYADRRDVRERAWRMFAGRGQGTGERDNLRIVTRILALRAERASLLGFATHAHWRLEDSMAGSPERARELLEAVWGPAVQRVREEVAEMQAIAGEGAPSVAPWDYRYLSEKVRRARYDLDQNQVKPYLQLERLREGMFDVAERLFGFRFTAVDGVPVYHPDVRVWRVEDSGTGAHVGLFYFDPYARTGKRSGAWMSEYRRQEEGVAPIVSNNCNYVRGRPGDPVLLSWSDARTLFHEFGHALHGLASRVPYRSLAGTGVPTDYVEFPSQILEHWLSTREVLDRFAVHHRTGEPMPASLADRLAAASRFQQGFLTAEFLASAVVDMRLHLAAEGVADPAAFERDTLAELGMPAEVSIRHGTAHFQHVFAGDSYAAAYYSYLWADVLTADAFEAFLEADGPFDGEVARRLHDEVFSAGNTVDPAEGYRRFRGRDPTVDALMRKRGLVPAAGGG